MLKFNPKDKYNILTIYANNYNTVGVSIDLIFIDGDINKKSFAINLGDRKNTINTYKSYNKKLLIKEN